MIISRTPKALLALLPTLLMFAAMHLAAQAPSAPIDPRIAQVLGDITKVRKLDQAAISPDGRSVAWVVDGEHSGSEIMVAPSTGTGREPTRVTAAFRDEACDESDVAWSPDSSSLAFLSNCQTPGQSDIYLSEPASNRPPRRLTHLHGLAQALRWSPDGSRVGFLYVEGATRHAGALAAMKPPAGVIGEEGLEVQRVAAVEAGKGRDGEMQQLTPAALHVFEFDWSPDSTRVAYIAAPPPGENNWWVAQLYTQGANNGPDAGNPQIILDPGKVSGPLHGMQIAVPRWSPDGKYIAFIGGLMSDQGSTGGDLYLLPVAGGIPYLLPRGAEGSLAWFSWQSGWITSGTAHLLLSEIKSGSAQFASLTVSLPLPCAFEAQSDRTICARATSILKRDELMHADATLSDGRLEGSLSLSADGNRMAFLRSSYSEPPEVFVGRLVSGARGSDSHALTHYNQDLKPAWGRAESVQWTSEGFHVQGWLLYPANYVLGKKYPMVVVVHGGPASAVLPQWPGVGFNAPPFAAMGYFAFEPNPRGSYGEGEAFTAANRKDFGYGDLRDILAGVDAITARYPVDPDRVGITGWSYGGFMTMFAVTQTQRFRAAVAGAGISNWQSYYGENSIDQWMVPYFGATVYDDPAIYAKSSAINFIHQAQTPTLVVVGDRDGECPAPQSFEFWHALRAQHVPTKLVVYPNEGHGFVDPVHRIDVLTRALAWFTQYMPAANKPTLPAAQ